MMVLESGRTMYFGKVKDLPSYLESNIGYKIPKYSNPCDYILDLVNCDFQETSKDADNIHEFYKKNIVDGITNKIEDINKEQLELSIKPQYRLNFMLQIFVLLRRNWLNHLRNPAIYWVRIVMYSMLCICLGTLYWEIGTDEADKQVPYMFIL